jgi:hypothetical protein
MNFDWERSSVYTSRRQNALDNNTEYVHIKRPLPINYDTQIDFCQNPFKTNNVNSSASYEMKRDSKMLITDRLADFTTLPKTQQYPVNTNTILLSELPINTRLNNVSFMGRNNQLN